VLCVVSVGEDLDLRELRFAGGGVVVLVRVAIVAVVVVTRSCGTVYTPISVDGDASEYSHNLRSLGQ
jgi:hypothetical protein